MKDIQNHGDFFSGENFYDFDSFLNFGNKFDVDVRVTKSTTSRPRLLPTASEMSLSVSSRRSTTKRPIIERTNTIKTNNFVGSRKRGNVSGQKIDSSKWNDSFESFNSYLDIDGPRAVNDDWYPWRDQNSENKEEIKKSSMNHENFNKIEKEVLKTKLWPSKDLPVNLSNLDKATVKSICKTTKLRDVRNLCETYALKDPKAVPKTKKPSFKKRIKKKPVKKKEKTHSKRKPRPNQHLFFKPNSFRRRKSEVSLFDSIKNLLWPFNMNIFKTSQQTDNSENQFMDRMDTRSFPSSKRRGWLEDALKRYGYV